MCTAEELGIYRCICACSCAYSGFQQTTESISVGRGDAVVILGCRVSLTSLYVTRFLSRHLLLYHGRRARVVTRFGALAGRKRIGDCRPS